MLCRVLCMFLALAFYTICNVADIIFCLVVHLKNMLYTLHIVASKSWFKKAMFMCLSRWKIKNFAVLLFSTVPLFIGMI